MTKLNLSLDSSFLKLNYISAHCQLTQVVRLKLNLLEALFQVLGAVVGTPIGAINAMGQIRFNGQRVEL